MLPWPEMITTGSSGWAFLVMLSTSSPSSRLPCSQMSRITSCGRRSSIAFSASSESRATRVRWPSSCRKPATISRMSASSSTIRMSDAICRSLALRRSSAAACSGGGRHGFLARRTARRRVAGRQADANERPVRAARGGRGILQREGAVVLLHALLDDGKAEAGALVALGGDIGLREPRAVLSGQARAVVDHLDVHAVAVAAHAGLDAPAPARLPVLLIGVLLDGLLRVLHQVDDRLGDEAPVAADDD